MALLLVKRSDCHTRVGYRQYSWMVRGEAYGAALEAAAR